MRRQTEFEDRSILCGRFLREPDNPSRLPFSEATRT